MASTVEELYVLVSQVAALTGQPAELVDELTFSNRAAVARIALGDGRTAIAKKPRTAAAFEREVQALTTLPAASRPGLIAFGRGVVVMEDLGAGPSLADLLLDDDRALAERSLESWARTVG